MSRLESIVTDRLRLREITQDDTERIVRWRANPKVYQFFLSPHAIAKEEHLKWFHDIYLQDENQISFIVINKENQAQIGVVGIRKKNDSCVEVNYLLDEAARGKGYASEAVEGMLEFAKIYWRSTKAMAEIHKENIASLVMIKRLGFDEKSMQENFIIFERDL